MRLRILPGIGIEAGLKVSVMIILALSFSVSAFLIIASSFYLGSDLSNSTMGLDQFSSNLELFIKLIYVYIIYDIFQLVAQTMHEVDNECKSTFVRIYEYLNYLLKISVSSFSLLLADKSRSLIKQHKLQFRWTKIFLSSHAETSTAYLPFI